MNIKYSASLKIWAVQPRVLGQNGALFIYTSQSVDATEVFHFTGWSSGDYLALTGYFFDNYNVIPGHSYTAYEVNLPAEYGYARTFILAESNVNVWTWKEITTNVNETGKFQSPTQKYLNSILANNARIFENNLLCARFSYKLSNDERKSLYALQTRLETRNSYIKNNSTTSLKESYPNGYIKLHNYLNNFMQNPNITGVITTIIITAIVVATVSYAVYIIYEKYAGESKKDREFSDKMTKILAEKLTPEENAMLKNETNQIVDAAVLAERFRMIKIGVAAIALIAVSFFAFMKLNKNNN